MRLVALALCAVLVGLLAAQCSTTDTRIEGSGVEATETREVASFTRVEAARAMTVVIEVGPEQSVVVRADDNLLDEVRTRVSGETLEVSSSRDLDPDVGLVVEITVPELESIEASGASRIEAMDAEAGEFSAEASGASTVDLKELSASDVSVDASGASTVTVSGEATQLDAQASGASTLDLAELVVEEASADASGASEISLNVTGSLSADASGASRIRYEGDPREVSEDTSGASNIGPT